MSPGGSVTAVHTAPYRIRAPVVRDAPAGQCGTGNGPVVYAALIMAQENLSRPYHRKERPFWKSASADRPGPGLCSGKVGKRLPEGPHKRRGGASARCRRHRSSGDARRRHRRSPRTRTPPNGSTSESASANRPWPGFRTAKSESDSRRGRTSGVAERQRDVADIEAAETPGEGTAGAPAQGRH